MCIFIRCGHAQGRTDRKSQYDIYGTGGNNMATIHIFSEIHDRDPSQPRD